MECKQIRTEFPGRPAYGGFSMSVPFVVENILGKNCPKLI